MTTVRVRWMECDAQGIVYNGAYLVYLEIGQAEYYRNLGFAIYIIPQSGYFDFAVVNDDLDRCVADVADIVAGCRGGGEAQLRDRFAPAAALGRLSA